MGSNTLGTLFRITTWGESHGKAIGVVIDGCPAGLEISEAEIHQELKLRRPGHSAYASPRKESDEPQILSGLFEGKTTGAPLSIIIFNRDVDSSSYEPIKHHLRPGHATFTYLKKYGVFDYRGGGRASARETACRVAAGAVAKKLLRHFNIELVAYLKAVGDVVATHTAAPLSLLQTEARHNPLFCPDATAALLMAQKIEAAQQEGDSLGGIVELVSSPLPVGLGDPLYEKLEANLAHALLTLPATKGVEFGAGFQAARMRGSEHNDPFTVDPEGNIVTTSNHAGGTLGGISTGMPLLLRVAFKPTSSIRKPQASVTTAAEALTFHIPEGSRHDPCVAVRAPVIVEAMVALVLADALLMHRCSQL